MGLGSNIFHGQKRFEAERTAEQLVIDGSGQNAIGFTIKSVASNRNTMWVGKRGVTSETGYELQPGGAMSIDILNASMIYVAGTRGELVEWFGLQP